MRLTYADVSGCARALDVDAFRIDIFAHLEVLNTMWLNPSTGEGGLCGSESCSAVVTVEVTCSNGGNGAGRRKRQTSDADVVITIPNVEYVHVVPCFTN